MSAMPATGGHSAACCNLPPIVTKGYLSKGEYEEVGGYKTCTCHHRATLPCHTHSNGS